MSDRTRQRARLDERLAALPAPDLPPGADDPVAPEALVAELQRAGMAARWAEGASSVVVEGPPGVEVSVWMPEGRVEPRLRRYTSAGWVGGGIARAVPWAMPTSTLGLVTVVRWLVDEAVPAVQDAGGWLGLDGQGAPSVPDPIASARHQRAVLLGLLDGLGFAARYAALCTDHGPSAPGKRSAQQLRGALAAAGARDLKRLGRSLLQVRGTASGSVEVAMNVSDGGGQLELILACRTAVGPIGMPFHVAAHDLHEQAHGTPPTPGHPRVALRDREEALTAAAADAVSLFRAIDAVVAAHPWSSEHPPPA